MRISGIATDTIIPMTTGGLDPRTAKRPRGRPATGRSTVLVPIRTSPETRRHFKIEAAKLGMTQSQLLEHMLDTRREMERRLRAMQRSPLHRPEGTTS